MFQLDLSQFRQLWERLRVRGDGTSKVPGTTPALAEPAPRRVGLALGGGGGKGSAHLGVLQVIEDLGLPIDYIVGTSTGGAVSVMYAAGLSLQQISQVFRDASLRRIATTDPLRHGLIGSRRRELLLRGLLGDMTFADLRLPCAVVATDLASGQEVVIDEGPLVPAILATTALPSIFPPVVRGAQILADGGILNNLPVDVAYRMGANKVVAVDLTDAVPGFALGVPELSNPLARLTLAPQQFAIASRAISLMMARTTELQLAEHPPTLLLRPNVAEIATLDMSNPERGWRAGEATAMEVAEQLIGLREWRLAPPPPPVAPEPTLRTGWAWPMWPELKSQQRPVATQQPTLPAADC